MNLAASADYYVANDGSDDNDGLSAETPLLTIDKSISLAGPTTNIYVAPGAYQTTAQYGVNLTANLIGCGATRDDVIIRSPGEHRTLRTASTAFMTNLTIIGNTDWKADKGGAVEMNFRAAIRERFASEPSLRLAATDPMCIGFFVDNELQFQKWIPSVGTEVAEPYLELYFRICREELAKAAPGKLYLGSRFVGFRQPGILWRTAARHCDVITVNAYANSVYNLSSKMFDNGEERPILVGEFHFGCYDRGMFKPGLAPVWCQKERARSYERFVEGCLEHPLIVGCHWFQYRDQPLLGRGDGEAYEIGFVDVCDRPYPDLCRAARRIGESLYEKRWRGAWSSRTATAQAQPK